MYDFLLQTILFASFAVIIYILARAIPRVSDEGEIAHASGRFDRLLQKLPLKEIDERLNVFFEKTLRRMKVLVMRSDNFINRRLTRLRKANSENGKSAEPRADLFEKLNGGKKE